MFVFIFFSFFGSATATNLRFGNNFVQLGTIKPTTPALAVRTSTGVQYAGLTTDAVPSPAIRVKIGLTKYSVKSNYCSSTYSFIAAGSELNSTWYTDNPVSWAGPDGTYTASTNTVNPETAYGGPGYGPGILFASTTVDRGMGSHGGWTNIPGIYPTAPIAAWVQIQLPCPKVMTRFRLYSASDGNDHLQNGPVGFTVTASNDGVTWTTIYTNADLPPGWQAGKFLPSSWMNVSSSASYLYYRINVEKSNNTTWPNAIAIGKWEIE